MSTWLGPIINRMAVGICSKNTESIPESSFRLRLQGVIVRIHIRAVGVERAVLGERPASLHRAGPGRWLIDLVGIVEMNRG